MDNNTCTLHLQSVQKEVPWYNHLRLHRSSLPLILNYKQSWNKLLLEARNVFSFTLVEIFSEIDPSVTGSRIESPYKLAKRFSRAYLPSRSFQCLPRYGPKVFVQPKMHNKVPREEIYRHGKRSAFCRTTYSKSPISPERGKKNKL